MSVLQRTLSRWTESFSPDRSFSITTRKVIGDYSYFQTDKIGEGFSSCVYRGKHNESKREVAIKVVNTKMLKKDQLHQSFLNSEIQTLKSVTHQPNILHLENTYHTKNNVYIITEYCETDLARKLKVREKLELMEALDIICQVLSGYLFLSKKGFVHRDLKPANILYKDGVYMIGDFGFAVLAGTIKTVNNECNVGSPLYMAPESLEKNKYNFSTDMWAIGVILYEMIKGKTPWYAVDEKELYHKIIVKPITKMLDDIPAECRDFLKGVLSLDPKERLSPGEALEWLNYFLEILEKEERLQIQSVELKRSQEQQNNSVKVNSNTHQIQLSFCKSLAQSRDISVTCSVSENTKSRQRPLSPFRIHTKRTQKDQIINQPNTPLIIDQPVESKIRTLHYYCKFIQRILLILTSPLKYQFSSSELLERYLVDVLLFKIDRLKSISPINNWCKFDGLKEYFANPNKELQKAIMKAHSKYRQLYHQSNKLPIIQLQLIQKSIHQLKKYLDIEENFDDKSVLLMDYLTTLYQLFRLEQRYDMNQFCSLCKLSIIMERNPTQISSQHLKQLNNKIAILGI